MSATKAGAGPVPSSRAIVAQLASPARLRVVAALVLGERTRLAIAARAELEPDQATAALTRLLRAGVIAVDGAGFVLLESVFAAAARAEAPPPPADGFADLDGALARVLRAYLVDGRLKSIPAAGKKRRAVLEYLVCAFEPGQRYSEVQVNAILRAWHDDVAALRRYLVDEALLARDDGQYWRIGGWVDVR